MDELVNAPVLASVEEAYRQASEEVDSDWDITIEDGLTDETW